MLVVPDSRRARVSGGRQEIAEHETIIPQHTFTTRHTECFSENRAFRHESVKFASFTTWIHARRQIRDQSWGFFTAPKLSSITCSIQ